MAAGAISGGATEDDAGADVRARIQDVLAGIDRASSHVIPALQAIQERVGFLPPPTFELVAAHFGMSSSRVYGIATFYAQFHLTPRGRHVIRVCQGTACHVRGSDQILAALKRKLGIDSGQATADMKYMLERVACLGSCGLAPAVVVDGKVYGRMTPEKTMKVIEGLS